MATETKGGGCWGALSPAGEGQTDLDERPATGFLQKVQACSERNDSLLCVGLDPEPGSLPAGFSRDAAGIVAFNRIVIEATSDLVCAYKPNLAFYEALGSAGLKALEETLEMVPSHIPTIGDAKRGDIPNTARFYAQALFGVWGFDSVTLNPYLGMDGLAPFLEWPGKGVWMLGRTSNAGAADLQTASCGDDPLEGGPLYMRALRLFAEVESAADKGVVAGATSPADLARIREVAPRMPLLIPGVGTQGGDARAAVEASASGPVVINASRSVLYGQESADPAAGVRARAGRLREYLNAQRQTR